MKKAAIYARVSTSQQREKGSSLESQITILTQLASEKGYKVSPEFTFKEDWTGEDLERPQLDRLRTMAREGLVSAIFAYSNDRLSRDPLHFLLLIDEWEKQDIEILFAKEPLDNSEEGKLIAYVRGYAGKLEVVRIKDRVRRGLRARAEKGLIVGGYNVYGYRYIRGKERGQGKRVVNEREAKIVTKIFKWIVEERLTARTIAIRLQEEGIPTPRQGKVWYPSTVQRILHRKDYVGITNVFQTKGIEPTYRKSETRRKKTRREARPREEWIDLPGVTPAIISKELFEAAQRQLRQNSINSPRNRKHKYLLSGRIKCVCGWSMRGRTVPPKYVYYGCRRHGKEFGEHRCKSKMVRAREIEALVWNEVKKALVSPETIKGALQRRQKTLDPMRFEIRLQEARGEIERLKKQERNLIYCFKVGEYDKPFLKIETRKLKEAQAKAKTTYEEIENQELKMSQLQEQIQSIETYCKWASQNLEDLDFEGKRLALSALDVQVVVDKKNVIIKGFLPLGSPSFTLKSTAPSSWLGGK